MAVKLVSAGSNVKFTPILSALMETATDMKETKYLFKIDTGRSYIISIEFTGDMYNTHGDEDQCVYYDLAISVNSLQGLANTLSCTRNEFISDMTNLMDELPGTIS